MSEINSFSDYTNKYNSNVDYSALFGGTSNLSSLGGTNIWRHRYKRRMEAVNMRARTKHFLRSWRTFAAGNGRRVR